MRQAPEACRGDIEDFGGGTQHRRKRLREVRLGLDRDLEQSFAEPQPPRLGALRRSEVPRREYEAAHAGVVEPVCQHAREAAAVAGQRCPRAQVERGRLTVPWRFAQQAVDSATKFDTRWLIEDELERRAHDIRLVLAGDRLQRRTGEDHAPVGVQYDGEFALMLRQRARPGFGRSHPAPRRPLGRRVDNRYRCEVVLIKPEQTYDEVCAQTAATAQRQLGLELAAPIGGEPRPESLPAPRKRAMTEKSEEFGNAATDRRIATGERHRFAVDRKDLPAVINGDDRHARRVEARLLQRTFDGRLPQGNDGRTQRDLSNRYASDGRGFRSRFCHVKRTPSDPNRLKCGKDPRITASARWLSGPLTRRSVRQAGVSAVRLSRSRCQSSRRSTTAHRSTCDLSALAYDGRLSLRS